MSRIIAKPGTFTDRQSGCSLTKTCHPRALRYPKHRAVIFSGHTRRTAPQSFSALQRYNQVLCRKREPLILPAAALPLILLAEDHPEDVLLMRLALRRSGLTNPLFVARDGQEVVDYLGGEEPYSDRKSYPFPSLLLLDLKMPRLNGFDVLEWLQERSEFSGFPIVVLSGSDLEEDVKKAKKLGAHDYRTKPSGVEAMVVMLHDLHARWLDGHDSSAPQGPRGS